ncbi:hypothetical protein LTR84_001390 [Exophiala bonariae]|uniref:Pyruvate decarboxylase n=1 Tax=Exophiala bonariae TaxID=1690606 RepID=A0AAV9NFX1_9EURO|nr:hypothetical protein LTR84_001390 [Exophiala bonariae]
MAHDGRESVPLAEYLFSRLRQLGVGAIHGVPGDYNLELLDYVEPAGLLWVGNANELNAAYATDGYARIKGIGALITTYGVGELSAINAIAGAFAERAPVVHIVGTPRRDAQDGRKMIHHTLGDGDYSHFSRMYEHVTVAQVNLLDPRTAPKQIDAVLEQCLLQSRPVYIQVPVDTVGVPVLADGLKSEIQLHRFLPTPAHDAAVAEVMDRIYGAKHPVILVDGETRPLGLMQDVQKLIETTRWPTFTTTFGTGLVDMSSPNILGIYEGAFADPETKALIDGADLVLFFGPHESSTNSYSWTALPSPAVTISFTFGGIKTGSTFHRDVSPSSLLSRVLTQLDTTKLLEIDTSTAQISRNTSLSFSQVSSSAPIKQDKVWRLLSKFLREGDILLGETGTAGYGVREMVLPRYTRLFAPVTWLSIGYMLPAAQGAALAQRELIASSQYHGLKAGRTILLIGDGSFQMTVQELSTIIAHDLPVIILLINNDGYTIERCIHGLRQKYNDIPKWRYLNAPAFFGAAEGNGFTGAARTYGELEKVLGEEGLNNGNLTGLKMVEVFMDREDAPIGPLTDILEKQMARSK